MGAMKPSRDVGHAVVHELGHRPNRAVEEYLLQMEKHRWVGEAEDGRAAREVPLECRTWEWLSRFREVPGGNEKWTCQHLCHSEMVSSAAGPALCLSGSRNPFVPSLANVFRAPRLCGAVCFLSSCAVPCTCYECLEHVALMRLGLSCSQAAVRAPWGLRSGGRDGAADAADPRGGVQAKERRTGDQAPAGARGGRGGLPLRCVATRGAGSMMRVVTGMGQSS